MTKKDDEIAATYVPPPAHMPQRHGTIGQLSAQGYVTISGSASLSAAIASVTANVRPADLDTLMEQLNRLKMPTHKLLAEGALKLRDVEIKSPLPDDLVRHTLNVTYQDRERTETREHEKTVAGITARGPMWAEIVKYALPAIGVLVLWLVFG